MCFLRSGVVENDNAVGFVNSHTHHTPRGHGPSNPTQLQIVRGHLGSTDTYR